MTRPTDPGDNPLLEQPFVAHLMELRDRLLRALAGVGVLFLCLFPFANDIYLMVAAPLMRHLPAGSTMIATEVASPFLTPFKLSLVAAVFLSMPLILYQLWGFVAPGLYRHEKRLVMPLVVSSTILFYVGMLFAYYVVFPLVFVFLIGTTPDGITVATDISKYLDFVLTLFFAFGMAFEVPIATIILVWMGVTTPESLREKRPYIIVGAFVAGMLLTPPDVISQTLLALPMWVLFELGIIFSRMFMPPVGGKAMPETDPPSADMPAPPRGPSPPSPAPTSSPSAGGLPGEPDPAKGVEGLDSERFTPLTPEQLDAELDMIEASEEAYDLGASDTDGLYDEAIDAKLRQVQELRDQERTSEARKLLYEVLGEGNPDQTKVARNILEQLDVE